jgi:hypothetical protein
MATATGRSALTRSAGRPKQAAEERDREPWRNSHARLRSNSQATPEGNDRRAGSVVVSDF